MELTTMWMDHKRVWWTQPRSQGARGSRPWERGCGGPWWSYWLIVELEIKATCNEQAASLPKPYKQNWHFEQRPSLHCVIPDKGPLFKMSNPFVTFVSFTKWVEPLLLIDVVICYLHWLHKPAAHKSYLLSWQSLFVPMQKAPVCSRLY